MLLRKIANVGLRDNIWATAIPLRANSVELEGTSIAHDQHHTVSELAKRWYLSPNTIRRLVADEPGVIGRCLEQGSAP